MLIATLAALAVALAAPAPAAANEDFASEPPFGGELPPPLVRPGSERRPPPGFELSAREAIRIADGAEAVRDERAESPQMRPVAFERGDDWQVSYFTGSGPSRTEVAQAVVDDESGRVLGAWHDQQLGAPLARGYSGAIAQKVNAPYVWLPLCLLFLAPFIDPRRPFRLLHLDLLVLLGLGVSLLFFNRGEITASVPLTYPVLGYVLGRMLWAGVRPRDRPGPLIPVLPVSWLAIGAVVLVCARIALNVADSQVIDIGVAGVVGRRSHQPRAGALRRRLRPRGRNPRRRLRALQLPRLRALRGRLPVARPLGRRARRPRGGDRLRPAHGARPARARAGGCAPASRAGRWGSRSRSAGSPTRSRSTR